jgi:glycosyltransferase involved in cell wall biosynthesis
MSRYYDITFVCDGGDSGELAKLRKYVDVVIYTGQKFETDLCIFSSAWGKRPVKNIKAKKYVQMVHADFQGIEKHWNFKYQRLEEVSEHWAGGENIAKTFEERYGEKCKVIHYLLDDEVKPERVLRLITTSRIGKEKGFSRIVKMALKLKESGIPFDWNIYGDGLDKAYVDRIKNQLKGVQEVVFRGNGKGLEHMVADADYSVQLSDTEGWAFAIMESLAVGTPVIATNFKNAYEQIEEGKTGYILDMELKKFDDKFIRKIYNNIPKFEHKPVGTEEAWIELIGKVGKEKKTKIIEPETITVKTIRTYNDILLGKRILKNRELEVSKMRAKELIEKGVAIFIN